MNVIRIRKFFDAMWTRVVLQSIDLIENDASLFFRYEFQIALSGRRQLDGVG